MTFFMATNKSKDREDYSEKSEGVLPFCHKIPYITQCFYSITLFYDRTLNTTALEKFLPYNRLKLKNIKVYGNNSSNYNCLSIPGTFFSCEAIKCLIADLYIKGILLNKM